jgi:alpha-L-arabinofuranosidase
MGVYLATLWPDASKCDYQIAAINLYTNYDGNGAAFGNTGVSAETSDIEKAYVYAAIENGDESKVTVVVANKNLTEAQNIAVTIESPALYTSADVFMITGESDEIVNVGTVYFTGNEFIYPMPPQSLVLFAVNQ